MNDNTRFSSNINISRDARVPQLSVNAYNLIQRELRRDPRFIPRFDWIRSELGCGEKKTKAIIKALRDLRYLEYVPIRGRSGKILGQELRVKHPPPEIPKEHIFQRKASERPAIEIYSASRKLRRKNEEFLHKTDLKRTIAQHERRIAALEAELVAQKDKENASPSGCTPSGCTPPELLGQVVRGYGGSTQGNGAAQTDYHTNCMVDDMLRVDMTAALDWLAEMDIDQPLFQTMPERNPIARPQVILSDLNRAAGSNEAGSAVGVVVNGHDGSGRRRGENITEIRWVILDLDGAPIDPVMEWSMFRPHMVVQTSPGKFHCYYRVIDLPNEAWMYKAICQSLAKIFDGDPQFCQMNQSCRIPGFWHQKREPYQVRVWHQNGHRPYPGQAFIKYFKPRKPEPIQYPPSNLNDRTQRNYHGAVNGGRNDYLSRVCWSLRQRGFPMEEARSELMRADDANSPPIKTEPGGERTINDMIRRAYCR